MKIKQHKESGLWIREDGAVLMPPCPNIHRFKHTWTYGSKHHSGYLRIFFRGKHYQVHRLIAETFIPNPNGYPTVDHINRVKTANFVENLRFADHKLQNNNRQICEASLERYGVRNCEDHATYKRAYLTKNPEVAFRQHAYTREWRDKQRALGRRARRCPDGKQHWLTDEEYDARYKKS